MNIKEIRLINFKNIEDSIITFKNNISGIYGPNGMGKTAIIEAISLVKDYFSIPTKKNEIEREKIITDKLNAFMKINENNMIIETSFIDENNEDIYKLILEFEKNNDRFFCSREELIFKKANKSPSGRLRYSEEKNLIKITSDLKNITPKITITNFLEKDFSLELAIDENKTIREVLKNCDNFYSLMMQLKNYRQGLDIKSSKIEKKVIEDTLFLKKSIELVQRFLENILTIELKDQLLCRETISIPIKCFIDNRVKTIIYDEKKNIYNEREADILEKTITEINSIISIIIPNSELICESKITGINSHSNTYQKSVLLYMKKNETLIPLVQESTGTIKLISLISVLIFCLKNKNSTVFIDELDVHIFEYLLATFLLIIGEYSKGQLVFTAHNLLPMEKLNKDSIIVATKNEGEIKYTFIKTNSKTNNVRLKYLKSQAMWSEENIDPLLLNIPKLEVFIQRLVLE